MAPRKAPAPAAIGVVGAAPLVGVVGAAPLVGVVGAAPLVGVVGAAPLVGVVGAAPLAEQPVGVVGAEPLTLWSFYIIQNKGATYAGVSPDPVKRLRKHNGELSGGAKYTQSKGPGWTHICLVHGFQTKNQALQFEWAVKHVPPRDAGGVTNRLKKLFTVLNKTHWTSKAPASAGIPLILEWKIARPPELVLLTLPPYIQELI